MCISELLQDYFFQNCFVWEETCRRDLPAICTNKYVSFLQTQAPPRVPPQHRALPPGHQDPEPGAPLKDTPDVSSAVHPGETRQEGHFLKRICLPFLYERNLNLFMVFVGRGLATLQLNSFC